jgi:hypothetical protein
MVALRASRLVCEAIPVINLITSPILALLASRWAIVLVAAAARSTAASTALDRSTLTPASRDDEADSWATWRSEASARVFSLSMSRNAPATRSGMPLRSRLVAPVAMNQRYSPVFSWRRYSML